MNLQYNAVHSKTCVTHHGTQSTMYVSRHSNKITLFIFSFLHHWVQRNQLLFLKNTLFARQCSKDDLDFMEELWAQCIIRRCLIWSAQRRPSPCKQWRLSHWTHLWEIIIVRGQSYVVVVSSLTWWPRRCATGEAWPNIMLSCQAGRPCDVRAHRNRLTPRDHHTWSHAVLVSFLCSIMIQANRVILIGFFNFFCV